MLTPMRLATAAAIVLLTVGSGYLLLRYSQSQVAVPGPTPTAASSPTPAPSASLDLSSPGAAIQTKWLPVGGNRPAPGAGHGLLDAMVISDTNVRLPIWYADVDSRWSLIDPTTIEMSLDSPQTVLANDRWECTTADTGTYSFRLSGDGQTLTLTALQDECAIRAQILGGDWSRWPCPNPASRCDPELAPGLHSAAFEGGDRIPFTPVLYGYSYSVPAGWSGFGTYLMRRNDPVPMSIYVGLDVAAASQRSDCVDEIQAGVGSTAAALTNWLATVPGLVATAPVPITVGGYEGLTVDLSVAPNWVSPCHTTSNWSSDGTPIPRFLLTLTQGPGASASAGGSLFLGGDGHARYILLDVGGGHNVLIGIDAPDEASWNDLVAAAMPVIETFQFNPEAN